MKELASAVILSFLAACSSTTASEAPAASANDRVTPSESEARTSHEARPTPAEVRESKGDVGAVPEDSSGTVKERSDTRINGNDGDKVPARDAVPAPSASWTPTGDTSKSHNVDADNTGINVRDRSPQALTPMQQGNSKGDIDITQRIRKAVMADGSLSMTAKNVKIITLNGSVTLRGPVNDEHERTAIEGKAKSVAGAEHVNNQIEVSK